MHFSTLILTAVAATVVSAQDYVTGTLGDAPITRGNPSNSLWTAMFHSAHIEHAAFNFTGTSNGTGVMVSACFTGISPDQPGPYGYHVHVKPVPDNMNCTATGGHLDPYNRTSTPPCDLAHPQTCEVGDLSGKHGKVPFGVEMWCSSYVDPYLSIVEGDEAYIGNLRSVVIHAGNSTRIACGNITMSSGSTPVPYPTGNYTSAPVPTPTGAASKLGASGMFLGMAIAVGAMLL